MYLSTDFMVWYIFNMKSMWEELCSQQHLQERRGSCMFFITHTPYNKLKKKNSISKFNSINHYALHFKSRISHFKFTCPCVLHQLTGRFCRWLEVCEEVAITDAGYGDGVCDNEQEQ